MTYGITDTGFNRKRLADIKTDLETALQAVFGENIDLNADSVFGQLVGVFSEPLADLWEELENCYNSMYPSTSTGVPLSNVVQFNGITRQAATYSTISDVTITGLSGTVIPAGSEASVSTTGATFATDAEVTIGGGGTVTAAMTAVETGPNAAAIGTLDTIETPIYGWTAVSNTVAAEIGQDEETDAELKVRRTASIAALGQNNSDSLYGQILSIDDVVSAVVIDNPTDSVDAYGVPAHSFECIVYGGTNDDIIGVIWNNTPLGILSHGDITDQVTDAQGFDHDVSYSRPDEIPIYFDLTISTNAEFPTTGEDDIKDAIVALGEDEFSIGDDVIYTRFFGAIHSVPGIDSVTMLMDDVDPPVGSSNITIDLTELATFSTTDIDITVS